MAKKSKKRSSSRSSWKSALPLWPNLMSLAALFALLIGIVVTLMAVKSPTPPAGKAASCSMANCNQCQDKNSGIWILTNYTGTSDPDGDQQMCYGKGIKGTCGGTPYCCGGAGQQWTTNMSACATPTPVPTNTPIPTSTPIPTQTPTPRVNTPTPTRFYVTATPRPQATATITPTPSVYILNSCNKTCNSDADCPGGLVCGGGNIFGLGRTCRNPYCKEKISCLCDEGTAPGQLSVVPTLNELDPMSSGRQIVLTVSSFTDKNGLTNDKPTICGKSESGAKVTVSIFPDGVSGVTTADTVGNWCWKPDKKLSAGAKDVSVVAQKDDGQGSVKQSFTVVASKPFNWWGLVIFLMVIIAIGFGGYVYYNSM